MAELPWTCTSIWNAFWTSTSSEMTTSFSNSIANASRFVGVLISSSCCSHTRTQLASPPARKENLALHASKKATVHWKMHLAAQPQESNGSLEYPFGVAAIAVGSYLLLKVNETSDG